MNQKYIVLVWVSNVRKRHHEYETLIKESISLEQAYSFRDLVYYHHDRTHGSMEAGTGLEKQVSGMHLDLQITEGDCHTGCSLSI